MRIDARTVFTQGHVGLLISRSRKATGYWKYSGPLVSTRCWLQDPPLDSKTRGCSSPLYQMMEYLYVICAYFPMHAQSLQLSPTLCDFVAHHASRSMGFSRQDCWSGLPYPPPGDLPNPGLEPGSPTSQTDSLPGKPPGKPRNAGVRSLSLLQGVFLTQESNGGLLQVDFFTSRATREAQ